MERTNYFRVSAAVLALALAALLSVVVMGLTAPPAKAGDTNCVGVLTGPQDNVVVPQGATCNLFNAQVKGNVKALENSRLFMSNNTIQGNIEGDKAEVVISSRDTVRQNIDIKEGDVDDPGRDVDVLFTTVQEGNIKIEKMTGDVDVENSTVVKGNVQVQENRITGTTVGLEITGTRVAEDLQVFKNRGPSPKRVQGNTVGENLQCKENDPPFVGQPNVVGGNAEDQCAQP